MSVTYWVLGVVAAVLLLLATRALRRQAAALAARSRAVRDDLLEPQSSFPTIVSVPAVHVRTVFARQALAPLIDGFPAGVDVTLEVTESEILVGRQGADVSWLPLSRVSEAVFVEAFEDRTAPPGGAFLRVQWQRGGEALWTVFELASWVDAEKVRQQVHLRLGHRVPP